MNQRHQLRMAFIWAAIVAPVHALDLSINAESYLTGGLFTTPVIPVEKEQVTITVRAVTDGEYSGRIPARVAIISPDATEQRFSLELTPETGRATGSLQWEAGRNGLYTVRVKLNPDNAVDETDNTNNSAEITVPVTAAGRKLHFVWYEEVAHARWTTCVTSAQKVEQRRRLAERGVIPLYWEFGGMSWHYYDRQRAAKDPDQVLREIEEEFLRKYTAELPASSRGLGIDETGGYAGSFAERKSAASLRSLVKAHREHPQRFFAVWHGGGVRMELARYYREGANLLLLETYVFRSLSEGLKTEDIYQMIDDRLHPLIRASDMIVSPDGRSCETLIALDTSERPDWTDLGEQEQVVRFIRRICPEMRGIAWYNGGYGGYGLRKSAETDRLHKAVLANADRLCFEYYIRPCVTLMRESLWLGRTQDGEYELTAAVSNIGGIDTGEVTVMFLVDGLEVGSKTAKSVPAGPSRLENRVLLKQSVSLKPGPHQFEARIVSAPNATVLEPAVHDRRFVP